MKFFIVDDDEDVVNVMTALLEAAGHEVASSLSGIQALPAIREYRPDCVITDLMMSTMNGLDLCDEIRSKKNMNYIKIIMITARDADHWREKADAHGAVGLLIKPINTESFVNDVSEILTGAD